jgi:hypothetical protein
MLVALGFPAAASLLAGSTAVRSMPPAAARRAACFLNAAPEDGYGGRSFEGQIAQFAPPQTLLQVRGQRQKVQQELSDAINDEDYVTAALLRDDLMELKQKDPAVMAAILREEQAEHVAHEQYDEAARCRDELLVLRRFLPQYQLAGLWKGNYPNHGDEMVRLHYQGDQLFATKVTGDEHVPAGEVTFRADLAAPADSLSEDLGSAGRSYGGTSTVCATPPRATLFPPGSSVLSPPPSPSLAFCAPPDCPGRSCQLTSHVSPPRSRTCLQEAVGVRVEVLALSADGGHEPREVEQFHGEGRIAARGFRHPHFVPGQLFLMDDDVIGFLWLPIGTFVVFSRVPEEDERVASDIDASTLGLSDFDDEEQ